MTPAQAAALRDAAAHAAALGLPLTRFLTIHWQRLGVPDTRAAKATGAFMQCVADWLRKRGHHTAWVWCRENSAAAGTHCHIALHIPGDVTLPFRLTRRWLERIAGARYRSSAIHTRRIAGHANAAAVSPDHYAANIATLLGYMTKATARGHGGSVIGKRCGVSQNIGAKERRAASRQPALRRDR
jgi:hypothetical protein